jgi:GDP-L-fucose synthase
MRPDSRIYVAGHRGLVGSAICRRLDAAGYSNLLTRTRAELDLLDQAAVQRFFAAERPQYVFLAAAKVGGIYANSTYPAEFIYENLAVQTNVIHAAWQHGAEKLLALGSSCIYPRLAPQPIREEYLLSGALEPTNEWYAIAKIAGLKMAQAYRLQYGFRSVCLMPTNLYGPGDNFDLKTSHVLPALIRKFHEAKVGALPSVRIWGTGRVRREFLHVDDLASAAVFTMQNYDSEEFLNVGTGCDQSIAELCSLVCDVVGYTGEVEYDASMPDGMPRKLLDVSRLRGLGWAPEIELRDGVTQTYRWFCEHFPAWCTSSAIVAKNPV